MNSVVKKMVLQKKKNMNYNMTKNFIPNKDLPRIFTILFITALIFFGYKYPTSLNQYSNLILVGITSIYVYVTYELLRSTRGNKISPYVNLEYIIISDLKTEFFKKYEPFVEKSEEYLMIQKDLESENKTERNIVFVKIENTGDSVAIDIELEIKYSKKTFFDEHNNLDKKISFKDLKKTETAIKIFEVYEHPSSNDYLEITESKVKLKDIALHNNGESPIKNDFSKRISHTRDEGSSIVFKTNS